MKKQPAIAWPWPGTGLTVRYGAGPALEGAFPTTFFSEACVGLVRPPARMPTATTSCCRLVIATLAALFRFRAVGAAIKQPPSFLFVLADDTGWGDVGFNTKHFQPPAVCPVIPPLCTPASVPVVAGAAGHPYPC
jgi:hypothetical protein